MSNTDPLGDMASWLLSQAATRAHRILHDRLASAGATGYEYRVLAVLAGSAPTSQAEIGRAVSLDPRDVTHTVRALESRGLLERQAHPTNRRMILVELTSTGRATVAMLTREVLAAQDEILAPLSASESKMLLQVLRKLRPR
jgi:DNA-binding MarR family transcriptional regulator